MDADFVKEHPYIYLSVDGEDMIFQITALFVTDIGFDYIAPDPTGDDLTSFFETIARKNWLDFDGVTFSEEDTVLIIGAGPTGVCTLLCAMLKHPKRIIVCEKSPKRIRFVHEHYPDVLVTEPEHCKEFVLKNSDHGGADVVLEVAGSDDSFHLAWDCARPNAVVTIVALYDQLYQEINEN